MPASKTKYRHIALDEDGVPLIAGTTMKVVELVMSKKAHGWSPEEMKYQYPHLSMAQIHGALSYYFDHEEEVDADIERRTEYAEKMRKEADPSPLRKHLKEEGLV